MVLWTDPHLPSASPLRPLVRPPLHPPSRRLVLPPPHRQLAPHLLRHPPPPLAHGSDVEVRALLTRFSLDLASHANDANRYWLDRPHGLRQWFQMRTLERLYVFHPIETLVKLTDTMQGTTNAFPSERVVFMFNDWCARQVWLRVCLACLWIESSNIPFDQHTGLTQATKRHLSLAKYEGLLPPARATTFA